MAYSVIAYLVAGCVSALDLRDGLDLYNASFHDKLAASQGLAKEFLSCSSQAYDERVTIGAGRPDADTDAGADGPMRAIHAVVTRVKESRPAHAASLHVLEDTLADWSASGYRRLDLRRLRAIVDLIKQWHAHVDFDEDALAEDGSRFAQLLLAYNKAYFGDLSYTVGPSEGAGVHGAAKVTSNGFVDRNGNVWRFPGLSVDLTKEAGRPVIIEAGHVTSQRLTADLARVFLEAFFDAAFREPAVQQATALQMSWTGSVRPYPVFDAGHPPIPLEALARVTRDALRAEAAVTSEVGKAVRGGSLLSTQNEAFAAGMETAAGVIAKKLVEHAGFCYFQTIQVREREKGDGTK